MAIDTQLSSLSNPLATVEQLTNSSSQLDGVPVELEQSIRYAGAKLTQAAGILLRLPQEIIAQAIVSFTRFYVGHEGGSFRVHAAKDISAASVYMTAKISFLPQSPRSVLNVYAYLLSPSSPLFLSTLSPSSKPDPETYYLSEGAYASARITLLQNESLLLRTLSFVTHVSLPHTLALTYLQTLSTLPKAPTPISCALVKRTIAHLNTSLLSPQLLYLTHQPPSLAVAAVYLAAREVAVKLGGEEWWTVFDVEREELGFLVVAMGSINGWVKAEEEKWAERTCPLNVEEVEEELERIRREDG